MAAATCELRGPISAVTGPCIDNYYCRIIPVWPTCHSRWNARMGPKMGGQLDDPPDSQEGESRPQRTVFGGDTHVTNQVKMAVGPIGPDHADLLRWVQIFKHTYTNPLANRMATYGLTKPVKTRGAARAGGAGPARRGGGNGAGGGGPARTAMCGAGPARRGGGG